MTRAAAVVRAALAVVGWPAIVLAVHVAAFDLVCYQVFYNGDLARALWMSALAFFTGLPVVVAVFLSRTVTLVLVPVVFAVDAVAAYFVHLYRIDLRPDTLALVYETDLGEASGFLDPALLVVTLAALALGAGLAWQARGRAGRRRWAGLLAVAVLFLPFWLASAARRHEGKVPEPLPAQLIKSSVRYFRERRLVDALVAARPDFPPGTARAPAEEIVAVLVIGESARGDHFALNGYVRPTTPRLAAREVVSYRGATACHETSRLAIPCLLTRGTEQHPVHLREKSLVAVFRGAGFFTAWLSNQRVLRKKDTVISAIAAEAEVVRYSRRTWSQAQDGVLLPWIDEALARPAPRTLLVVHTIGSHWPYVNRHDAAHARFQPACQRRNPAACTREALVNSYDNSILYTDAFVADVIARLLDRNALLLYTSDHGESLGEDGLFGHGQGGRPEQRAVPFIVWPSPEFQRRHPDRTRSLRRHLAARPTHDHVFHSLLDCAGVESALIDPTLSLCRGD